MINVRNRRNHGGIFVGCLVTIIVILLLMGALLWFVGSTVKKSFLDITEESPRPLESLNITEEETEEAVTKFSSFLALAAESKELMYLELDSKDLNALMIGFYKLLPNVIKDGDSLNNELSEQSKNIPNFLRFYIDGDKVSLKTSLPLSSILPPGFKLGFLGIENERYLNAKFMLSFAVKDNIPSFSIDSLVTGDESVSREKINEIVSVIKNMSLSTDIKATHQNLLIKELKISESKIKISAKSKTEDSVSPQIEIPQKEEIQEISSGVNGD